jgi:hypothetical protein
MIVAGSAIIAASGLFVIWRGRQLALMRKLKADGSRDTVPVSVRQI